MLIGITGHKCSGKSTISQILSEALNYDIKSFATPLKKMVCALLNCTMSQLEDYDFKENTKVPKHLWPYCANGQHTVRALLQGLGDVMRKENPNVFVNCTLHDVEDKVVISDCRFPNEAYAIKKKGGVIIKIIRDGVDVSDEHQSETKIDSIDADYIIENNSSLKELCGNVGALVEIWRIVGLI